MHAMLVGAETVAVWIGCVGVGRVIRKAAGGADVMVDGDDDLKQAMIRFVGWILFLIT